MPSLKELQAEVEHLWALELEARLKAAAAERAWRTALKEHYGNNCGVPKSATNGGGTPTDDRTESPT